MDMDAGPQGQGANANNVKPENDQEIDKEVSYLEEVAGDNMSTVDTNAEENLLVTSKVELVESNGSNASFELQQSQGSAAIATVTDDSVDPKTSLQTDIQPNHSEGNKINNNPISASSVTLTDASMEHTSDEQRETDTKSPEMLLDEVQKEVTKLNISGEEPKFNETSSTVIINNQNESLKNLMAYSGDSDSEQSDTEHEPEDKTTGNSTKPAKKKSSFREVWRKAGEDASGTSDSESDSWASTPSSESESDSDNSDGGLNSDGDSASVIIASDDGIRTESPALNKNSDKGAVKKKSKALLELEEFLPPLPDLTQLNINAQEEFMHIGKISAVIAELVTVEAIPGTPAFDLDSMLFIDDQTNKKPIGPIFDVLGPVAEPIYCVRFNSEDEITKLGLKSGMKVYAAPKSEEFSKFVFVKELMKIKGTDASWLDDEEAPSDFNEFSDDEQERGVKRSVKASSKRKLEDNSLERHRRYEKTMNQCNTLNTRVCKLMDAHKNLSKQIRPNPRDGISAPPELPSVPAEFNPTVPPPGFGHPSPYSYPSQQPSFMPPPNATFGQSLSFSEPSPYSVQAGGYGASAMLTAPAQFGSFYANQSPAPHGLGTPPARWQQCDNFRRGRHNQRAGHRQNADNYFTNNSRNFKGAGPSSQPF